MPPARPPPKRLRLVVGPKEAGCTLEALIIGRGGLSRERFAEALAAGGVSIGRQRASAPGVPLRSGDEVVVHLAEHGRQATGPRALDADRIVYLDDQLVVVDKPPDLAAQGTAVDAHAGLDAAVSALLGARGQNRWVGLVHRLDFETTGLTVFGRTPAAVTALAAQFRESTVEKRYLAFVHGLPAWHETVADGPLGPDPARAGSQMVSSRGRPARTEFRVLRRFEADGLAAALVEARPRTGRTHQIRVHLSSLGHPLLGDRRYGGPALLTAKSGRRVLAARVALHAARLAFQHPDGRNLTFESPLPADLDALDKALSGAPPRADGSA